MQKFIRIAAIVSASLIVLYLLIILIILPFQQTIIQNRQLSYSEFLPIFPTAKFVLGCLTLACIVWLVLTCYGKSKSITSEILILICLFIVLPSITNYVSSIRVFLHLDTGVKYYSALATVNSIYTQFSFVLDWAKSIAYAVCGMRIAFKLMNKKPKKLWDDAPALNEEF